MHDGGEDLLRRLNSSRNLERFKEANKMVEPRTKSDSSLASSDHGRASVSHPIRTHSLPQPYLLQPPTSHHVGAFYHLSPRAAVDPSHYPQTIVALEEELQRAHKELKELKEQLAASETGKAQAWREFTNIKNLLDQISLVEHFAASDNVEVETTPLPPNWSSGDMKEIDKLRTELEAAKNLNSSLASELERAKQEMNEARRRQASHENSRREQLARLQSEQGNIYVDLDNAKRDISTLQANLSEAWSHHSEKALELARAREEIAWLEADAHSLGAELAHARKDINLLHEDLDISSAEVSRLRRQYESEVHALQAEVETRDDEIRRLQGELAESASAIADRESQIGTLQSNVEVLNGTSSEATRQIEKLRGELEPLSRLQRQYESTSSQLEGREDEIRKLQRELTESGGALRDRKSQISTLQSKLEVLEGTDLEATRQIEKLRGELEPLSRLQSQYESTSSELQVHEDEICRLQGELAESARALEDKESQVSILQSKLEVLKGTSSEATRQIEKLRGELEPLSRLQSQYESTSSALRAKIEVREDEIRKMQGELTESARALEDRESQISTLQSKLERLKDQHDTSDLETTRQIEKLRGELEPLSRLQSQYESTSSESQAELKVREDEIHKLQGELTESARALEDRESQISTLQSKLKRLKDQHDTRNSETARQIEKLRGELEPLSRLRSQYESTSSQMDVHEDEIRRLQRELTESGRALEDRESQISTLQSKLEQHDTSNSEATRQIEKLRSDLETMRVTYERCSAELFHAEKRFQAEHESIVTDIRSENLKLQGVVASLKAENLAIDHEAASSVARMQSELIAFHELVMAELVNAREEIISLQLVATEELQHVLPVVGSLKVEMCEVKTLMLENSLFEQKATTTSDARLRQAREAEESFRTRYRDLAASSEAQIESLKRHMYELRDTEARAKEALVSTSSELQKKKVEFEMAKEALEWVGGDAAALSAEVEALRAEMNSMEALRAEITCTKEGEAKAKAAFTEYSLKLQKMRRDLENATQLADKARTFKMDLDEATVKLDRAVESERAMTASVASLKAELSNAWTQVAEKQLELSQMRAQWEAAVISEAKLTDENYALNESLHKVIAEAEEAAFAREQATAELEKARTDAEQADERVETLEAKMETLQLEVEASKATEDWAFAQMRLKTIPEFDMEEEEGGDIPVSLEEYHSLRARTRELQELVNKRAAVGMAQVNAARASEREMQGRLETVHRELRRCRAELTEAIAKRDEAEAALQAKRLERKALSHSGTLDVGGRLMNAGDVRQGSMNSICFEDSQSSSPSRSSKSFASFASPGRSERSPVEQVTRATEAEESKQRKLKLASKIGAYFSRNLSMR